MTQKEKELLLKDLCARLPYHIKCQMEDDFIINDSPLYDYILSEKHIELFRNHKGFYIKPYLRSMSSITEEERKEIGDLIKENRSSPYGIINNKGIDNLLFSVSVTSSFLIDWLNAHHFDYRELIEKGLAIAVTKENNPYKE